MKLLACTDLLYRRPATVLIGLSERRNHSDYVNDGPAREEKEGQKGIAAAELESSKFAAHFRSSWINFIEY